MLDSELNVRPLGFMTNPRSNSIILYKIPGDFSSMKFNKIESIIFGGTNDHNF